MDDNDESRAAGRSLFDDPAILAAADARALADIAAGRLVDHAAVARWLEGWGSTDPWAPLRWR